MKKWIIMKNEIFVAIVVVIIAALIVMLYSSNTKPIAIVQPAAGVIGFGCEYVPHFQLNYDLLSFQEKITNTNTNNSCAFDKINVQYNIIRYTNQTGTYYSGSSMQYGMTNFPDRCDNEINNYKKLHIDKQGIIYYCGESIGA